MTRDVILALMIVPGLRLRFYAQPYDLVVQQWSYLRPVYLSLDRTKGSSSLP